MKAHAIFHSLSDSQAAGILQFLHDRDRAAYRACLQLTCTRRRFRPVMAERKPLPERHAWLRGELSRKANDDLAAEILQSWLLGAHRPMVCGFLDRLHVPHDGEGLLESLPAEPPEADLRAAVNDLLTNHPREAACVYLHLFSEMDIAAGWSHLRDLIPSSLCPNPPVPAA